MISIQVSYIYYSRCLALSRVLKGNCPVNRVFFLVVFSCKIFKKMILAGEECLFLRLFSSKYFPVLQKRTQMQMEN